MNTQECCNHNCNQGRDCPRRNKRNLSEEITEGFKALEAMNLTDEEIDSVGDEVVAHIDTYAGRREFARAILRKAQEK